MPTLVPQCTLPNVMASPFVVAAPALKTPVPTNVPALTTTAPTPATMARRALLPSMLAPPLDYGLGVRAFRERGGLFGKFRIAFTLSQPNRSLPVTGRTLSEE